MTSSEDPSRPLAISFASDQIAPGDTWEAVVSPRWFREDLDLFIALTPLVDAWFVLERANGMSREEMRSFTQNRIDRPGVFLRYRNRDSMARRFEAVATVSPNVDALKRQIGRAAEEAWRRAGTPESTIDSFEADLAHFKRIVQASTKGPMS